MKVKVKRDQAKVKVERNQAKVKEERNQDQDQDAHLTHSCVGVGRAANPVAPLSRQLVELGVYRLGWEDNREVTPTAQLSQASGHAYVAGQAPRGVSGTA